MIQFQPNALMGTRQLSKDLKMIQPMVLMGTGQLSKDLKNATVGVVIV
jgi:hypothetical protein